jgi:hypothetical protein
MYKPHSETIRLLYTGIVDTVLHLGKPPGAEVRHYIIDTCDISKDIGLIEHPHRIEAIHVSRLQLICENTLNVLLDRGVHVVIRNVE